MSHAERNNNYTHMQQKELSMHRALSTFFPRLAQNLQTCRHPAVVTGHAPLHPRAGGRETKISLQQHLQPSEQSHSTKSSLTLQRNTPGILTQERTHAASKHSTHADPTSCPKVHPAAPCPPCSPIHRLHVMNAKHLFNKWHISFCHAHVMAL